MKEKWIHMYMDLTHRIAEESHAKRLKVGAMFVSPDGVMSIGINGLPAGGSNECERSVITENGHVELKTKDEVSHAEEAVFSKLMLQGVSTKGGTVFLTHSPCIHCAKIIVGAGIKSVYYSTDYRDSSGIDWLKKNNVRVEKVF